VQAGSVLTGWDGWQHRISIEKMWKTHGFCRNMSYFNYIFLYVNKVIDRENTGT
jgi:hypothetical protein